MLLSYLRIAIRNLRREKVYAVINVAGLAVAIAACVLFGVGLHLELTVDGFYEDSDRLYRVLSREIDPKGEVVYGVLHRRKLAERLVASFPQVEEATRVVQTGALVSVEETYLQEVFLTVDPAFLGLFPFPLIAGSNSTVLAHTQDIVISPEFADRFFSGSFTHYGDLLGRSVLLHGRKLGDLYTVSGVLEALPRSRSLKFEALIRFENHPKFTKNNSWDSSYETYVKLQDRVDTRLFRTSSRHSREPTRPNVGIALWANDGRMIQTPFYSSYSR